MISPYAPGGGTDFFARVIGQKLSEALGVSVVTDNRPGAGGVIGADVVAKAPPDGYTLLMSSPSPLVVSPHLLKSMPYDPQKDLAPVIWIAAVPALMTVHPSVPAKTVGEFIKLAKAKPGQLTYSSSGNGGTGHLAGALFDLGAGTKMIHVPYKGTGPATTALISGEVTLSFGETISLLPQVKAGRLRALAVTTLKRLATLPNLPTVAETIPGYTAGPWYGILVPAKTPSDIITKLNGAVANILRLPDIQANLASAGAEAKGGSAADLAAQIKEESERWGRVIREAKIQVE
ncbi:MAG: tripartite tricarboxylate transporter substrate binding protein [Burkholderiales bacterium]